MKICDRTLLKRKGLEDDPVYLERTQAIIAAVRARGDAALRELTERFDQVALTDLWAPDLKAAYAHVKPEMVAALKLAAERVEKFHRHQPLHSWVTTELGGTLGQLISPLGRVACYAPGGTAPLPSSLIHSVVVARVAGVPEIIVATPPNPAFAETGYVSPVMLVAADIAGAQRVLRVGGAQAVAALAYGTESIRPVDKIVGPGNIYVVLAKKLVFGVVGIESLPGPTETVVVADAAANPAWVAADLLAQAEHDVLASAILLTPSRPLAQAVQAEMARQLEKLSRAGIVTQTFEKGSGIVLTRDVAEAVALADEYAPEHLCLAVCDPWDWVPRIKRAGGVFVGEYSFEVLGDYVAGPSHIMPTAGSARFSSPVNVWDFVRLTSLIALDRATTAQIAPTAALIAHAEGLTAHAAAAEFRQTEKET